MIMRSLVFTGPRDGLNFSNPVLPIYGERKKNANWSRMVTVEESKHILIHLFTISLHIHILIRDCVLTLPVEPYEDPAANSLSNLVI